MKYVLDTNAVSALMKGDVRMLSRLERVSRSSVAVPQPVFAEIAYGIERLPKSRKKETLRQRYELLRAELPRAVWNDEVTDAFGRSGGFMRIQASVPRARPPSMLQVTFTLSVHS